MEILVLAAIGFALVLTLGIAAMKVVFALVLVPFKFAGLVAAGIGKLVLLLFLLGVVVFGVALLPVLIPVGIVAGVAVAVLC